MKKLKIDFSKMGSFLANFLSAILSVIIAFLFALPFGVGYAIDWVTNLILYTVIIEVSLDFVLKLKNEKEKICWKYVVGCVLVLLTDWCFMATAHQTENQKFFAFLAITAFLAVCSAVWFAIVVKRQYEVAEKTAKEVE